MRTLLAIATLLSAFSMSALPADTNLSADQLLQRGVERYRAAKYGDAVTDLSAAAQAFLAPEKMQAYVSSGSFENLGQLETALVYLALAQSRQGRDDDARAAILRIATAERIAPTYAGLQLGADKPEFETLSARLVSNTQIATSVGTPPPTPAVLVPAPMVSVPTPMPTQPSPPQPALAERERVINEMIAQERARIEGEAEERIAAIQRQADQRVAAAEHAADERIAAIRLEVEQQRTPVMPPMTPRQYLGLLRDATTLAAQGQTGEANLMFNRLATSDAPREVVAEAAVGLYRTGAHRDAVEAFRRMGVFGRGEEDLRYYFAVALYETGTYAEARRELSCALPYIEATDDVTRYRVRIEQTFR